METDKKIGWMTKFGLLPILLRIVIVWVYLISILSFLRFFSTLVFQLRLDPFALALGYLFWVLADGLVDRSNLARIIATVCFGLITMSVGYIAWNGGVVSLDGLTATFLYPSSMIWMVASGGSLLILLLPHVRRVFLHSTQEGSAFAS